MHDEQRDGLAAAAEATDGVARGTLPARRRERAARSGVLPLAAQVPELSQQLERARDSLKQLAKLDPRLYARVSGRFADLATHAESALDDLRESLPRADSTAAAWDAFRETRAACKSLFDEVFAFVEGALVRQSEIDAGLCTVADALLDDLSERTDIPWGRLTIVAERDFLGEVGEIVRLRFPELSAWSLPIAVHEFGHFIGPEIRRETYVDGLRDVERPFRELLRREREATPDDSTRALHLHEYFGDMFATFAAGPAYPYACIVLRFDPSRPRTGGGKHPPPERRVELMLSTLKAMDDEAGLAVSYRAVIDEIRELWHASRAAADAPADLAPAAREAVHDVFAELYPLLRSVPRARYEGLHRARALATRLDRPLQPGDELRDILNAAWFARLAAGERDPLHTAKLEQRARMLCHSALGSVG